MNLKPDEMNKGREDENEGADTRDRLLVVSKKEFPEKGEFCLGNRGIKPLPRSSSVFGFLLSNGMFGLFDVSRSIMVRRCQLWESKKSSYFSSFDFSPDGANLLVSLDNERILLVYKTASLTQTDKWVYGKPKILSCAKWVSDNRILAAFGNPGEIAIFKLNKQAKLLKFRPKETSKAWIYDFAVCQSKTEAIFAGGSSKLVFKMKISGKSEGMDWSHKAHGYSVAAVALSKSFRLVLSGDWDSKIVLAREESGEVLCQFIGFSNEINGIFWGPSDDLAIVFSLNGAVLVSIGFSSEGRAQIKKETDIKGRDADSSDMNAAACIWGLSNLDFMVIGTENGKIFKIKRNSHKT